MIAFRVTHNGTIVTTSGIGDLGVLTTSVTWVRRLPQESTEASMDEEELTLHIGGLHSPSREHRLWHAPSLAVGDKVEIEILVTDSVTPHDHAHIYDRDLESEQEKIYFRQKAIEWGWAITEPG